MFSFLRSIPPEVADELERLRKLEELYGPAAKLADRLGQMIEEYETITQRYDEVVSQLEIGERAITLAERELQLRNNIQQLEAKAAQKFETLTHEYTAMVRRRDELAATLSAYGALDDLAKLEGSLRAQITNLNDQIASKHAELNDATASVEQHKTRQELTELGLYEPVFSYDTSAAYEHAIRENAAEQKAMVLSGQACVCATRWALDGNTRAGDAIVKKITSLALRAFNNECEVLIARATWRNYDAMRKQIERSFSKINSFVSMHKIELTPKYLTLKLAQLTLTHEHAQKLKQEKDTLRRERELERENERAEREYQQAIAKANEEEARYQRALEKARAELGEHDSSQLRDRISELEAKLARATAERERAKSMAQMTRSGYVYVISNIGSFGETVFKVGMTRRLDPMERVLELGDASVPFAFDVHCLIWTADAPGLESELHRRLDDHRVNRINYRKEFFSVDLETVRDVVKACAPDATFVAQATAEQYYQSIQFRAEG